MEPQASAAYRLLTIIDEGNREELEIAMDPSLPWSACGCSS